ncbi:DUF6096 family protein [Clostridium cadaveris]|uniref:DUF6096 family protein n=1 Tax=Clostridium cadaveris TaxID=1529 RepID=UPI000C07FCB5|nr:DUF6096 family protein [Clostridium cadaveris]MDM8312832.1 DUF6096 family protein [Clostridium cadaveris]NWK12885.1 hypothetical protein [Clostridium cadaveris]
MALYKILTVKEMEYKLKLTTSATICIEDKLGCNILDPILEMSSSAPVDNKGNINMKKVNKIPIPSLKYLVTVLWGALQKYHHGMTFDKTCNLVDEYIESGKTQMDLFEFIMDLLTESGILGTPEEKTENLK